MNNLIFSNAWWQWVWDTYNYSILGFPIVISFILKLMAIFIPTIPSGKIIDLIKEYWPKGKTNAS
jgi:hypothetical protein